MSAHTPGPWMVAGVPPHTSRLSGSFEVVVDPPGGEYAVITARGPWNHRADESEANARLIAAAPDLLAACEALLGSARNDSEHTGPSARALALSAIAKARGTK